MAQTFTSFTPVKETEAAPPAKFTSFTPLVASAAPIAPTPIASEPQEPMSSPMGDDFSSAIMAASALPKPVKKQSVLEGIEIPELKFDPEEAKRLSRREYAQEQGRKFDPRYQQKMTQGGPRKPPSAAELSGGMMQNANPLARIGQKALQGGAEGVGGVLRAVGDVVGSDTLAGTGEYMGKNAREYQQAMGPAITGGIQGFGPKSFVPDLLKYTADMGEGAASSLAQSIAASSLGPAAVIPTLSAVSGFSQYNKARDAGQSVLDASINAALYAGTEYAGGKFVGLDKAASALKNLVNQGASTEVKKQAGDALFKLGVREIPGELATYLGQTGVDLLPGIGLNPNLTMAEFLDGLRDTVVQAGMMGGAAAGAGKYLQSRAPQGAPKPIAPPQEEVPSVKAKGPLAVEDRIEPTMEPVVNKREALKNTLAEKIKARAQPPVQAAPVIAEEEVAPAEVTPEVQTAPLPELETLVAKYKKRGYMPEDAAVLAQNEIDELTPKKTKPEGVPEVEKWTDVALASTLKLQQSKPDTAPAMVTADTPVEQRSAKNKPLIEAIETEIATRAKNKGEANVAKPISQASGEGAAVSTQPADNVPPTTGVGGAKRDGVVSPRADVTEPTEGKGTEPVAVEAKADVSNTLEYFEKRDELIKQLDAAGEKSSALLDKITDLDSVRAESVLGADGKPLVFDENGKYDSDKKYEAKKTLEAERNKASAKFDAVTKQLDELDAARAAAKKTTTETKGAELGTETTKTVQAAQEGQEATTAVTPAKPRGRPKAELTEEQRAEKEKTRTEGRADYMKGERALPKLQAALDKANAPIDETTIENTDDLINANNEKQADKRAAIHAMLDLEAKHRGTELGKRIKTALADRTKISKKEHDDIVAGRKYKAQERVSKSNAGNEEVEAADEGFKKATNASQAINHVVKTGTGIQKFLAKRLRGFTNGVKFVVVEESDPLPANLERHKESWGNDNSRARGVYFESTATGEKVIYVRGASAGEFQGINNTTVLHELLHAAVQQKLELALLAVQRGFSGDAKLTKAYKDLLRVMNNAKDEYNRLSNLGELPTDIYYLKTVSGVFSNPHEFVSYGMTDPYFQKFLMGAHGFEEDTSFFNKFVDAIRELLGMGLNTFNALSDLIVVTDKILSAKLTPPMQMVAKADRANAQREGRAEKVSAAKANSKKVTVAQRKITRSKEAQDVVDGIDAMVKLRDPNILLDAVGAMWHALNVKKLEALLPALQTNVLVEWGSNLGINHMEDTWRAMQDMGAMRMKMLGGASDVVTKWLDVQPGLYGKLIKGKKNELAELSAVMHYATDKSIDPATNRKDAALNKMWDGLSDKAKEIYIDVRDYYKSNFDLYRLLLDRRIDAMKIPGKANDPDTPKGKLMAEIKKMYETAKGLSPYFPLMRYGDYWLRVGSGKKKEFYMFEGVAQREMFMRQRVRQLQAEGDERSLEKMKADQDIETGNDLKGLRNKSVDNAPLLKEIFELVGDGIGELDAEALKDQIYQLYLTTMPEQSFRRQFIHRKGTAGFSGDALRNFITSSTNMANQLARLKYGPQMIREVDSAKESLKGNPEKDKLEMLVNELGERVQMEVYPPAIDSVARGIANVANKSAFLYFMTSVKTAVIQFSSLPVFGAPVLMSRHSPAAVLAEMGKMMLLFNDVGVMDKDGKFTLPTLANSRRVKMNEEEQRAVEAMADRGVSEITMAYDLMDRSKTPSAKYSGAWKTTTNMMGALFHHTERLNREIMFMTSFRLSRKEGMSFDDAIDQAVKDTYDALGNFSEQNRARIMRGPVGRTLLQFKTFPAFVTTYLARNGYRAMAGMDADAKKEAATQLFGTLFMSGLLAGYVGIPGISAAMGAIQGLINAFKDDDDDDPLEGRDIEFWFRNVFVPNFFGEAQIGGYKISELIDSGLVDTITGYNMSNSMSMNNMWMPELKEQRNLEDTMQEYALSLMGPSASLLLNQIPSGVRLLMEGKTMQGLEKLLPAALRQPLTAVRYSKEGATTSTGAVIKEPEEFTKAQLVGQALGARTTGLASVQEANFKANALKAKTLIDKNKIISRLDLESMRGSDEELDVAIDKLLVFNSRNPQLAVKGTELSKMLKNRLEKRLKADRGFDVDKKFYPYLEELLAPSREKIEREAAK